VPALALGYVVGDLLWGSEFSGVIAAMAAYPLYIATFKALAWQRRRAFDRDELAPLIERIATER